MHNAISSLYSFRLIANLAMIEFASHPDYSLPSDEGIRAVRKDDAMYPSSRRLKVRCGGFFSIRRVITGRTQKSKQGEKLFQILLHLRVSAQKVSKLKSVRQFRPNAFKFPQFPPGISHFQSRLAKIREIGIYSRRPRFFWASKRQRIVSGLQHDDENNAGLYAARAPRRAIKKRETITP